MEEEPDRHEDEQAAIRDELNDPEFLLDIRQGLADIEVGRVIRHEEAKARLLDRYKQPGR